MTAAVTWAGVHVGDTVRGADARVYTVTKRERGGLWLGSGVRYDVFTLRRGEGEDAKSVTAGRGLTEPAPIVARADHGEEHAAAAALLEAGLTVEILSEGQMTDSDDSYRGELAQTPETDAQRCARDAHPDASLSTLKSGEVLCTACMVIVGRPFVAPPEPAPAPPVKRTRKKAAPAAVPTDVPGALQAAQPAPDGSKGGGAAITGSGAPAKSATDPFDVPAAAVNGGKRREPPRGQWGWYKIPHPLTGVETLYPRVTTIADTLDDQYGLTAWKLRMAVKGVSLRPDLIALAASADVEADTKRLNDVVSSALDKAEAYSGANYGTALHKFAERLEAGESVKAMGVPAAMVPDLEAYEAALKAHGLTALPEHSERTVVNPDENYAGTWDRPVRDRAGAIRVLDLKSGQSLEHVWLKTIIQLALYSRARYMCSLDFTSYEAAPEVDQSKALVMHLPIGSARAQIYGVDIDKGWRAARAALAVRAMRTEAKSWNWLVAPESPADVVRLHLARATSLEELSATHRNAVSRGIWTDELATYALMRYDILRVRAAVDRATLGALWTELHPVGRWTEEVHAAALARELELNSYATT
jgi:hypothetical protein